MSSKEISYAKIKELRDSNLELNLLLCEIERKTEAFIEMKNSARSYNPKGSNAYKVNFKVNAVKMTADEEKSILKYLYYKYIEKVRGDYFVMKKCLLAKKYKIMTVEHEWM